MSVRRESRGDAYDVVVVGSGLGGLTAGAVLARAGKRVLVLERHDRPGGYAHAFRRGKYIFDAAVHLIGGADPTAGATGGIVDLILRILDVREQCQFLRVEPFYTASFPGFTLRAPLGVEPYIGAHLSHFPDEANGFRRLLTICARINREVRTVRPQMSVWDLITMPRRFPTLAKYHKATLAEAVNEHVDDTRLRAVFASLWPYLGVPPSRLSFVYWSLMLFSFLEEGAFYCRGSFQRLADTLAAALRGAGGELLLVSRVRRIMVRRRQAAGVVLENGQRIEASVVISNADAMQTFEELVGIDHLPVAFVKRLRRLRPSLSAFVLYLATDLNLRALGAGHETFVYRSWDHEQTYLDVRNGRPAGVVISVPTLIDPSLAPPGQHIVTVTSLIPYGTGAAWRRDKARYVDLLLDEVEAAYPGIRGHITFAEGASPRTMERYTLNQTGAIYGWEATPNQVGPRRLGHSTPIHGLYLSGHWTQPGGGTYAVMVSGLETARMILGYRDIAAFVDATLAARPASV